MSFQGLVSGSECAVSSNPLSQVIKHTESDRSLQQDKFAGPSSVKLNQLDAQPSSATNQQDVALARQFFEIDPQAQGPAPIFSPPHTAELAGASFMVGGRPLVQERWALEQSQNIRPFEEPNGRSTWAMEFGNQPHSHIRPLSQNMSGQLEYQQRYSLMAQGTFQGSPIPNMYRSTSGFNAYQGDMNPTISGKGKGKEIDFDAAFARVFESLTPSQSTISGVAEVTNSVTGLEEALEATSLNEDGQADFHKVWDQLQNSDLPPSTEEMSNWESEFNQLMSAQRDELDHDYGEAMQSAWENGAGDLSGASLKEKPLKFDQEGLPILGEYVFDNDNKYLDPSISRSLLSDAKDLLSRNGSLSEAGLLLEAAIQKKDLGEGGYESWILLGETRNMDEREDAGMRALMEGVRRAEEAGAPGPGMLSLAISFTNESYDRASHTMLLRWLRARYPSLPVSDETMKAIAIHSSWDTHSRITDLFLTLARSQHREGVVDSDVQTALGVLFYTNVEYDRAKDCFESALGVKPQDYLLWNRLGSSLSNGNQPEEALGAYREALQLRPTYTRAIYNVGVACLNIGAYKEAAEHFLSALNLQESTSGDTSDQLWLTLHRALMSMDRPDLAKLARPEAKTKLEVFRNQGFDF